MSSVTNRIRRVLLHAHEPLSIDYVRFHAKTSWANAKAILLELFLAGEIEGQKTSKSWIFWPKKEADKA